MKLSRTLLTAAAGLAMAASALPAFAVTVYTLDNGGSAFATPGNYGTVSMTQNGADVDFSITLAAGFNFVSTGGPHDLFAFNGAGVALADITNLTVAGGGTLAAHTPGADSPFGTFGFGIDCTNCKNGGPGQQADPMTFKVVNALISDFESKSTGGNPNAFFSADVISGANTGAVGSTGGVPNVPEPETYAQMLAGLGAVGIVARRRRAA